MSAEPDPIHRPRRRATHPGVQAERLRAQASGRPGSILAAELNEGADCIEELVAMLVAHHVGMDEEPCPRCGWEVQADD